MKTIKELEDEIINYIETIYDCKFTGKVIVKQLNENTYTLELILNKFYVPLNITREGTQEEFLTQVKKEIKSRRLNMTEYYSGYKYDK